MISPSSISGIPEPSLHAAPQAYLRHTTAEAEHDAALVARFKAGDTSVFIEIAQRHHNRVFSVAFSTLRNRADAEEIVQDTWVRAHRGLGGFRGDCSLGTWLHRIALNLSRNRYWYFFRRQRHATHSFDCAFSADNGATYADLIASEAPNPAHEASNVEFSRHVATCMAKLNESHREILGLLTNSGLSYDEIALKLGIKSGTVKSRIARARTCLRQLLLETYAGAEAGASQDFQWFEPRRPCSAR